MRLHLSCLAMLASACVGGAEQGVPCDLTGPHAVVDTSDFRTGALAAITEDGCVADTLSLTSGDAVVRATGGRLWVLNRSGGAGLLAYAHGDYQNPVLEVGGLQKDNVQDLLEHDGQVFVAALVRNEVVVLDPSTGNQIGEIDLSAHADDDGFVEAHALQVVDGTLYVSVQRLDLRTNPVQAAGAGRMLAIDTNTLEVVASYDVGENPKLTQGPSGPVILTGLFFQADGALSLWDPASGEQPLVLEADLGLDFGDQAAGVAVATSVDPGGDSVVGCFGEAGEWREAERSQTWFSDVTEMNDAALVVGRGAWDGFGGTPGMWKVDPDECVLVPWGGPTLLPPSTVAWMDVDLDGQK